MSERTLSIIKPDAVAAGAAGAILSRVEEAGFQIVALRMRTLDAGRGRGLLRRPPGAPLLPGPLRLHVLRARASRWCSSARTRSRTCARSWAPPIPRKAADGTIRKDFATSIQRNCIHGSDAPETARFEIGYFFPGVELV